MTNDTGVPLTAQRAAVPHATPGPLTAPFWQGCADQTLLFQRCAACAAADFPPAEHCRQCLSTELGWERSRGRGVVYSWTVVYRAATPVFETPYAPAIVTLDEGYQMLTNVIGASTEQLRVGLVVAVDFHEVSDGLWLPYFRPV
jgi:uncharacterized OB-fold protein